MMIWVTRDNRPLARTPTESEAFATPPKKRLVTDSVYYAGGKPLQLDLVALGISIEPGECKQYKLVEVTEVNLGEEDG